MEKLDKNSIIGIALLMIIFGAYTIFTPSQATPDTTKPKTQAAKVEAIATDSISSKTAISLDTSKIVSKTIKIENDVLEALISTRGAQITSLRLKKYKSYQSFASKKDEWMKIYGGANANANLQIVNGSNIYNTQELNFESNLADLKVIGKNNGSITFKANTPTGVIEKTLSLSGDSYEIKENTKLNAGVSKIKYTWSSDLQKLENDLDENRKAAQINYYDKEEEFNDIGLASVSDNSEVSELPVKWTSFKQKYFTSGVVAENGFFENSKFELKVPAFDTSVVKTAKFEADINLSALKDNVLAMKYYFGPNDLNTLKPVGNGFHQNLYLGYDIVKPINRYVFVPLFNWVESFIKNYGLLIILVVLIIKLAVTPLIYKSYVSSAKMRLLAPEVNAIKEKIGDDAMKIQQETMKLYQQVGVSPLSGCVPLLLQMPILMSVFFLFPNMIMFRQKSFLWANDLSTFDAPISWATNLPIIGNHISLFVVLMTISSLAFTYYNNQITPDQPGPIDMKKISYVFPLVFFFVLNSFPAALSFYYLVSNVVTIIQQLIVRKFVDESKITALLEKNRKEYHTKPQKKNKFGDFIQKQLQASEELKKQTEEKKKNSKKK